MKCAQQLVSREHSEEETQGLTSNIWMATTLNTSSNSEEDYGFKRRFYSSAEIPYIPYEIQYKGCFYMTYKPKYVKFFVSV